MRFWSSSESPLPVLKSVATVLISSSSSSFFCSWLAIMWIILSLFSPPDGCRNGVGEATHGRSQSVPPACTFTAQRTPVFFRCAVLGTGHAHAVSTVQPPLPIDFGKLVVECEQTLLEVIDISSENLVERNLIPFIYRYHGAMHVWVEFVKVYIEAYDIILPPFVTRKPVHVLSPKFYLLVAPDM